MIDINWFAHKLPGLKPDWFGEIKSFSRKCSKRLVYTKRSKTFPQMGSRDTLNIADASTSSAKNQSLWQK